MEEKSAWDEAEEAAEFLVEMRDWAKNLSRDQDYEMSVSNRVGLARIALDAEAKRQQVLQIQRPEVRQKGEVVVRVEGPPGVDLPRPPVPAKHRDNPAYADQVREDDERHARWLEEMGGDDGDESEE